MADRIVLLGPQLNAGKSDSHCLALELSALNASALLEGGTVRACVTQYSGPLADATVLELSDRYVGVGMEVTSAVRYRHEKKAWEKIAGFLGHMHGVNAIKVKTPIPLWDGGRRRYTDGPDRRMIPREGDLAMLLKPIRLARKQTLPAGQNGTIDNVSDDEQTVVFKYLEPDVRLDGGKRGTLHLVAVAAAEVEVVP